jgi:two-component system CheB/CheR fusion protein
VGELHHRLQNTLAVVLALSRLTASTVNTVEEFQVAFSQRIEAMARTNALLLRGQVQAVNVQVALETELQPYIGSSQVKLICDPLSVAPDTALSLSLIFHELATNAAKYGALAKPGGRLTVECRTSPLGGVLHWREHVTKPLKLTTRTGSGTLLIDRLARALGGTSRIQLLSTGLDAEITFKLDHRQA